MEIQFLGTGSAWSVPEYSCRCAICSELVRQGEERTRTSFLLKTSGTLLVDCGPDVRRQMVRNNVARPDAVLITHEHADHFLGLDDLLAFRRAVPKDSWQPIPVYATAQTWPSIEQRFGYLIGSLLEKREAVPRNPFLGPDLEIVPFKTYHGPSALGSVGYCFETHEGGGFRVVYTSDFLRLDDEPDFLFNPDVLIIQSHWLNEPRDNRPNHMSFQRAMDYIRRWKPKTATYLVHISAGDQVPGDPCNNILKKLVPLSPLTGPEGSKPYLIPRCQAEWTEVVDRITEDWDLPSPIVVAQDGMVCRFP